MPTKAEIQARIKAGRDFIRLWDTLPDYQTDQQLRKPQPPLVKAPMTDKSFPLPMDIEHLRLSNDFLHIVNSRKSSRVYTGKALTLTELSYLLWTTQGVKEIRGKQYATLRTVPCGGARHEFECYAAVLNVEGLQRGLYHYLPIKHRLEFLSCPDDLENFISESLCKQNWACKASVVFYYSMIPYRAEWRYGVDAHRVALIDAGHITENLYLACSAASLGTCAIGAVVGELANAAFNLDGEEEFIFYAMPVGRVDAKDAPQEQDFYAFLKEEEQYYHPEA